VKEPEIAAAKNPPAYGAWNVQIVTTELGRPSPAGDLRVVTGEADPITRFTPGSGRRAGWASEAAVVLLEPSGHHNRR